MKRNRWMIVIAVAALVIAVIFYGFVPRPFAVDPAKASRGPLMVTIEEEGKTRVRDRFIISSPVSGFMRRVGFDVGDPVNKGQTVVELEPLRSTVLDPRSRAAAEAAVASAEAGLRAAEENSSSAGANADYAKANAQRLRKLFESGYVSRDGLEQAETEAKRTEAAGLAAKAAVKAAKAELDKAGTALGYSAAEGDRSRVVSVRSPVSGNILRILHESEGAVNAGEPLVEIGDPSMLEVKVEVLSADAVRIRPGMPVLLERWGGDFALSGKVRVIEPAAFTKISSLGVEEQRTLVIADITSPSEGLQRLGDGYRVEARFIIWEGKDVLQIPASALFRTGDSWAVFVEKNRRAELRNVEIGHRNGLSAEILSGVAEGDMVITHPDEAIKDGTRVRAR
ncbi:MAG: efflux RND transporter periplasmic adaptor subunit [Nitrospirae bacterium]|nr:efflux RND transporter periplasmic adaptor subunit [Nitrospirota bacterium]